MGLRDLIKKKDKDEGGGSAANGGPAPEFTIIRSDTHGQEVIHPPAGPQHDEYDANYLAARDGSSASRARRSLDVFKPRSRSASASSTNSTGAAGGGADKKRLSQRLHLSRSPSSSDVVPQNLPAIVATAPGGASSAAEAGAAGEEDQWEARATMLARENEKHRSRPSTPVRELSRMQIGGDARRTESGVVSSQAIDANIQEAIRLHEEGDLEQSTRLFGQLADPKGANNPLSQVLYGLALRHGWGCAPDTAAAVSYLSAAASNAATVETLALQAGLKKGGAAKGELVLAIFELANCFRHGWGIPKDAIAAKQYYETAANLGDTDAMNEIAWCYLEGFGCKKDKFAAAKYYRLAEDKGNKTLGNSWIWKDKYNPENAKKK